MPDIDVTVVREKSGGIRCIYFGCYRIVGQKPYVSERLSQQVYPVPMKIVEDALALAHNESVEDDAYPSLRSVFDTTNDALFEGMQLAVEAGLREDVGDPSLAVTRAVFAFLQAHFSQTHGIQKEQA